MSATVLNMSISLDGFAAGPNERPDTPLGDGGHRLHAWFLTGADGNHEGVRRPPGVNGRVPIFILTRRDPEELRQWPLVSYVNDVTDAMTRAKRAAGDKQVLVHGVGTARLALAAVTHLRYRVRR
jgi:hypothetical protein